MKHSKAVDSSETMMTIIVLWSLRNFAYHYEAEWALMAKKSEEYLRKNSEIKSYWHCTNISKHDCAKSSTGISPFSETMKKSEHRHFRQHHRVSESKKHVFFYSLS